MQAELGLDPNGIPRKAGGFSALFLSGLFLATLLMGTSGCADGCRHFSWGSKHGLKCHEYSNSSFQEDSRPGD